MVALWRIGLGVVLVLAAAGVPGAAGAATFDAIAIDDTLNGAGGNGDYAVGTGPTRREAERVAMSNCTLGGNVACRVKLTFQRCGAYAVSPRRGGTGLGDSTDAATGAAMAACADAGCKLVVADCVAEPLRPPR